MGAGDGGALLIVRPATGDDAGRVRGVRLEALAESPHSFDTTLGEAADFTEEDWRRWIAGATTFLVETDERAHAIAVCAPYDADRAARLLASLWVRPELRGTGLGFRLVCAVRACAKAEGATMLVLHVGRENGRARRFYERHGFSYTGGEVARVRDGAIELEMALELT